jgi:hypothetical protein
VLTSSRREWNRNNKPEDEDAAQKLHLFNLSQLRRIGEFIGTIHRKQRKYDKIG